MVLVATNSARYRQTNHAYTLSIVLLYGCVVGTMVLCCVSCTLYPFANPTKLYSRPFVTLNNRKFIHLDG